MGVGGARLGLGWSTRVSAALQPLFTHFKHDVSRLSHCATSCLQPDTADSVVLFKRPLEARKVIKICSQDWAPLLQFNIVFFTPVLLFSAIKLMF